MLFPAEGNGFADMLSQFIDAYHNAQERRQKRELYDQEIKKGNYSLGEAERKKKAGESEDERNAKVRALIEKMRTMQDRITPWESPVDYTKQQPNQMTAQASNSIDPIDPNEDWPQPQSEYVQHLPRGPRAREPRSFRRLDGKTAPDQMTARPQESEAGPTGWEEYLANKNRGPLLNHEIQNPDIAAAKRQMYGMGLEDYMTGKKTRDESQQLREGMGGVLGEKEPETAAEGTAKDREAAKAAQNEAANKMRQQGLDIKAEAQKAQQRLGASTIKLNNVKSWFMQVRGEEAQRSPEMLGWSKQLHALEFQLGGAQRRVNAILGQGFTESSPQAAPAIEDANTLSDAIDELAASRPEVGARIQPPDSMPGPPSPPPQGPPSPVDQLGKMSQEEEAIFTKAIYGKVGTADSRATAAARFILAKRKADQQMQGAPGGGVSGAVGGPVSDLAVKLRDRYAPRREAGKLKFGSK